MSPRFLVVSTIGFVVDAGCTLLLIGYGGLTAGLARVPAFLAGSWVPHILNRTSAFNSGTSEPMGQAADVPATGIGAVLNYAACSATLLAFGVSGTSIFRGVAPGALGGLAFAYRRSSRVVYRD